LSSDERDLVITKITDTDTNLLTIAIFNCRIGLAYAPEIEEFCSSLNLDFKHEETPAEFWRSVVCYSDKSALNLALDKSICSLKSDSLKRRVYNRQLFRNDLQNVVDPDFHTIYPLFKGFSHTCNAIEETITAIKRQLEPSCAKVYVQVLYRAMANMYFFESADTSGPDKDNLLRCAEELYTKSVELIYPDGFDDKNLSGKAMLAFFHYMNGDVLKCSAILSELNSLTCLPEIEWITLCDSAVAQEWSCRYHSLCLEIVDIELCSYLKNVSSGKSIFVNSGSLVCYMSTMLDINGCTVSSITHSWLGMFKALDQHLSSYRSVWIISKQLRQTCSDLYNMTCHKLVESKYYL